MPLRRKIVITNTLGCFVGEKLTVIPHWNMANGRCELLIEDVPHTLEEVSKRALGPLFFDQLSQYAVND